jgi:hypothetical protein
MAEEMAQKYREAQAAKASGQPIDSEPIEELDLAEIEEDLVGAVEE